VTILTAVKKSKFPVEKIELDRKELSELDKPQLVQVEEVGVPALIGTLEQYFPNVHTTTHRFGILEKALGQAVSLES
jgi:hypothetical protein